MRGVGHVLRQDHALPAGFRTESLAVGGAIEIGIRGQYLSRFLWTEKIQR